MHVTSHSFFLSLLVKINIYAMVGVEIKVLQKSAA